MTGMVYKWKPHTAIKLDAQKVGEHLEKLRIRHNGQLTPQAVLEDAKSSRSPIHKAFEWNDTEAAREYRVWQARYLINHIVVVVDGGRDDEPENRAFVNVKLDKKTRSYTSRVHAMSEQELREQMIDGAIREILAWRNRYADLHELAPIVKAIDALVKRREKTTRTTRKRKAA